ncbi:hypothetical protein, partial [Phenylobacterium sp.]|uniref:hypothetical protein n=1 Tax=Phenylobacterium sp. TaxID=1871053 RepID=UPI0025E5FB9C
MIRRPRDAGSCLTGGRSLPDGRSNRRAEEPGDRPERKPMSASRYPLMFSPLDLGFTQLKNRVL